MHVPGISNRLYPRKGGGGKGGGGSSSSGGKGGSSSVSGLSGGKSSASSYGKGGGKVSTISSGLFAGRTVGGGTRDQVYGNRQYGSGYPGVSTNGVGGRGFPFYFWPLAWGAGLGYGAVYLHNNEYGLPDNASRPGGPMFESIFTSSTQNTTFYLIADNTTTISLVESIQANCSSVISNSTSATPVPYNASDHSSPQPEQAVQYYRASSAVLLLQNYNNTADLTDAQNQTDTPLPSNIDTAMLACLNDTIGEAVPLIDGASSSNLGSSSSVLGLVWVLWCITKLF